MMGGAPASALARDKLGVGNLTVTEECVVPRRERLAIVAVAARDGAKRAGQPGGDTPVVWRELAKRIGLSAGLARRRPAARQRQKAR
jgi:hypothetical protein